MRSVGEYCSRNAVTARPNESLLSVARQMREHHVGCVVVVEPNGTKPIGLVTDRDIVVRVLAQTDQHLEQIRVDDIMGRPVATTKDSDDLGDALSAMRAAGVRRLPVVDSHGTLVGLLSFDDLFDYFQDTLAELASLLSREQQRERRALP